MGLTSA
ncbi:hypothetical protein CGLO_13581 [Colletotrichum gloeosporioides Cg-14]|nr:hypothetical protein CGLO_13581 [Colletotrichum gloeosporioides Cg-14]